MLDGISNFEWKRAKNLVNRRQLLFTKTEWHSKFGCKLCKIRWEKHPIAFVKVVEGSEIYNFPIHHFVHFYSNFWRNSFSNRAKWIRDDASPRRRAGQNAGRAPRARHAAWFLPPSVSGPVPSRAGAPSRGRAPQGRACTEVSWGSRSPRAASSFAPALPPYPRCSSRCTALLPAVRTHPPARVVATKGKTARHISASGAPVPSRDKAAAVLHWRSSSSSALRPTPLSSELTAPSLLPHVSPSAYQHTAGAAPLAGAAAPAAAAAWHHRPPSPAAPLPQPSTQIDPWWAPHPLPPLPRPGTLAGRRNFGRNHRPHGPRTQFLSHVSFQGLKCKARAYVWVLENFQGPGWKFEYWIVLLFCRIL
jgi:hypothetical protein